MINKKFTTKKIIWIVIVLILLLIAGKVYLSSSSKDSDKTVIGVTKENIEENISETGIVRISDEIGLSFKSGGTINIINAEVGDNVDSGKTLATVDYSELNAQLQKANASLKAAQAQLANILVGATSETISLAETQVKNTEIKLKNKEKSLEDIKISTKNNIESAYEDASNVLNDAYLDIYNSYLTIDDVQQSYFNINDQDGTAVKKAQKDVKEVRDKIKNYIDTISANPTDENIDIALSGIKTALDVTYFALSDVRNACESILYRSTVTDTDKTTIDTRRASINTERTNSANAQQSIASTKITGTSTIDSAQASVVETEGQLEESEKTLEKLIAGPTKENVNLYEAQTEQAQADRLLLISKINQSHIKSPVDGQIIRIKKRKGETAGAGEIVVALLPQKPFQIKTNIYEEDIAKINIGNPVKIQLIAFPNLAITGTVASIEPIDNIVDGVVYYEVSVDFDKKIEGIKPGMSTDISITISSKNNVLVIPESALVEKNGKLYVNVLIKDRVIEKEIKVGTRGDDNQIEIIKGLNEGEQVIIP